MATGKQLSFMCGEVSPEYQFNSQEVSYATGLKKLRNGFVRNAGGVSNRQGFLEIFNNPMANSTPVLTTIQQYNGLLAPALGRAQVTAFTFWNELKRRYDILEMGYFDQANPEHMWYRYNFGAPTKVIMRVYYNLGTPEPDKFPFDLHQMRFTLVENRVLITPYFLFTYEDVDTKAIGANICFNLETQSFEFYGVQIDKAVMGFNSFSGKSEGQTPILPVAYLMTAEGKDGTEYVVQELATDNPTPETWSPSNTSNPSPWYPHTQMYTVVNIATVFPAGFNLENSKVRLYRSAWLSGGMRNYKLVAIGKLELKNSRYRFIVNDYGAESAGNTPPTDFEYNAQIKQVVSFAPADGAPGTVVFNNNVPVLAQATAACFHQQRLHAFIDYLPDGIFDYNPDVDTYLRPYKAEGTFMASKLNAPVEITPPLIFSNVSAFSYKLSSMDGDKKLAMLAMERNVIFTSKGVTILRGAFDGVVTPTEVNPLEVSSIGCHDRVEPKKAGTRGYYLSSDGTKLMGIFWSNEDRCEVLDASKFSAHLLKGENFVKMEALSNSEESVFLLTSKGRLVHVSMANAPIAGFSLYELKDGYIENIFKIKSKPTSAEIFEEWVEASVYRDELAAYVVRNGVRRLEILSTREEDNTLVMNFSDSSVAFGATLTKYQGKYAQTTYPLQAYSDPGVPGDPTPHIDLNVVANVGFFGTQQKMNIGDASTSNWEAGQTIPVYADFPLFPGAVDPDSYRLDFYWEDSKGNIRTLRGSVDITDFVVDGGNPAFPFPVQYQVIFEEDVPEVYQNVKAKTDVLAEDKELLYTNHLYSFKRYKGTWLNDLYSRRPVTIPAEQKVPVNVYADRWTVSSVLNPGYVDKLLYIEWDPIEDEPFIDFGDDYFAFGFIGYPYQMEAQTLPIESSDNRTFKPSKVIVNNAGMALNKTMGGFVGIPNTELKDMAPILNKYEDPYDMVQMPKTFSGYDEYNVPSEYNEGIVAFKHVDPTPFTLLAVYPRGQASN